MELNTIDTIQVNDIDFEKIFKSQKQNQFSIGQTTASERIKKLKKFGKTIMEYREKIRAAMYSDFSKHQSEVDLTEIYPVTKEIKFACKNLRFWMKEHKVGTPFSMLGSSSYIKHEPKGVVLIMSPWNFPFNLTFSPLVSAVAAGNTVIVKPSEHTPNAANVMKEIIDKVFTQNEVALINGGVDTAKALLALPFNHIFFTGAPSIGKLVMQAAAKHLTSVTLELGGKSPTIVDESANIEMTTRRLAWGKFINNGQICLAPDYVCVHSSIAEEFYNKIKEKIEQYYTSTPENESSYARIVNKKHFTRLKYYLDDALKKGAKLIYGGKVDPTHNYMSPTILEVDNDDLEVMKNEIFGPILVVKKYTDLEKVITNINEKPKPLALYVYSSNKKNIKYILNNTRAGGGCINHSTIHYFNSNLPFGGSNNSGIGKSHGWFGYSEFSNKRGILKQNIPNALELLLPPYNDTKQKLIDLTIKYF